MFFRIEIYLAEYDKRTFPRDCKLNFRGERTCIDNVLVFADSIIRHPDYDDKKLYADIALIRLHGNAPYTGIFFYSQLSVYST